MQRLAVQHRRQRRASLYVVPGSLGHLVKTETGEVYTTATAPCTPPSTTTTTLPTAVPMGTAVALSYSYGDGEGASGSFTISRIWMNATPQFDATGIVPPGTTFSSALSRLLQGSHLPPGQQLMWIGVDLTVTNTGQTSIGLGETGGPGPPAIYFVVNGRGPTLADDTDSSDLSSASGFEMGVPGCPSPFHPRVYSIRANL